LDHDPAAQIKRAWRRGLGRPDPSDQDRTAQDAHERLYGAAAAAPSGYSPAQRGLGLGCPICRADYAGTKHASARTTQRRPGGRRSGGDSAKGGGADGHGGASPVTPPRRYGAPRRQWTAPTGPSPCGEAPTTSSAAEEQRAGRLTAVARLGFGGGAARARLGFRGEGGAGEAAPLNRQRGRPGVRARGTETARHGRRVGLDPGSAAARGVARGGR
jgi:hypothetical protein